MDNETLLYRQVHPDYVQTEYFSSQVFKPTAKDEKQLSVYDGDQISAEAAWLHFSEELNYDSAGVVAVTVEECSSLDLSVISTPDAFPEHVVIDFSGLSRGAIRRAAQQLQELAERRGWQYRPSAAP